EKVERVAGVGEERGNGLAGVDGAAAADGDHVVAQGGSGERDSAADVVEGRLAGDGEVDARGRVTAGGAGDDEGSGAERGEVAGGAFAEDDPGGGGELEAHLRSSRRRGRCSRRRRAYAARRARLPPSIPTRRSGRSACGRPRRR